MKCPFNVEEAMKLLCIGREVAQALVDEIEKAKTYSEALWAVNEKFLDPWGEPHYILLTGNSDRYAVLEIGRDSDGPNDIAAFIDAETGEDTLIWGPDAYGKAVRNEHKLDKKNLDKKNSLQERMENSGLRLV